MADKVATVKASFNLPEQELEELRQEANERHVTVTQVLREALADRKFFKEQEAKDHKILLKSSDGEIERVILRH